MRGLFEAHRGGTDWWGTIGHRAIGGPGLLYLHGGSRNLNPGMTTSIKLGARLEGFLETDVHGLTSGSGSPLPPKPPDLCWPEGVGPHAGYSVVLGL